MEGLSFLRGGLWVEGWVWRRRLGFFGDGGYYKGVLLWFVRLFKRWLVIVFFLGFSCGG